MADEDYGLVPYKDISELKKELESIKDKKDVSTRELYEAVSKLAAAMEDMLEVFGAAAEQLKLEEKEYEAESRKHDTIISRLDKLTDQNRTIAEGLVAMVEMVKEKFPDSGISYKSNDDKEAMFVKPETSFLKPKPELMFTNPAWKPAPEQMPVAQMPPMPSMMPMPTQAPDLGQMPPMQAEPMPDLDFPEDFPLEEEPKKKGLFGVFKK